MCHHKLSLKIICHCLIELSQQGYNFSQTPKVFVLDLNLIETNVLKNALALANEECIYLRTELDYFKVAVKSLIRYNQDLKVSKKYFYYL